MVSLPVGLDLSSAQVREEFGLYSTDAGWDGYGVNLPAPLPQVQRWIERLMPALMRDLLPVLRVMDEKISPSVWLHLAASNPLAPEDRDPLRQIRQENHLDEEHERLLVQALGRLQETWERVRPSLPGHLMRFWLTIRVGARYGERQSNGRMAFIRCEPELKWYFSAYSSDHRLHGTSVESIWRANTITGEAVSGMASQIDHGATHHLQKELKRGSQADATNGYWPPDRTRQWLSGSGLKGAQRPKYLPAGMPQFVEISAPPLKRLRSVAYVLAQHALLRWPQKLSWPEPVYSSEQALFIPSTWDLLSGNADADVLPQSLTQWLTHLRLLCARLCNQIRERTAASGHGWYLPDLVTLRLGLDADGMRCASVRFRFGPNCEFERRMFVPKGSGVDFGPNSPSWEAAMLRCKVLWGYAPPMTPHRLLFPDLPPFLSNLDPHAPLNARAFDLGKAGAFSDLELDLMGWEESVRWLAGGWDCEEEYSMDMLPRFRLDAWLQKPDTFWTDELWQRLQVADLVYRRRSEAPSRVIDILNWGYSAEEAERRLALWRAQPVRFWFVWVQPLGL